MAKSPVAEVSVPPASDVGALVWPQMCSCCGSTTGLSLITIYAHINTLGPSAEIHLPYCRRCMSHHGWAYQRAFASAAKVVTIGFTILLLLFLAGILLDGIVA